jgi:signal peptidase II
MFYFPLIRNSAGEVLFFRPVFNFADSCITCAVIVILLFYMKELNTNEKA